jgi:hypothetical protein
VISVLEWAAPNNSPPSRAWAAAASAVGYVASYTALNRLGFIEALHGIGITPWNPTAGLALALLIIKGLRWSHQARYPSTFHFSGKALGRVT